MQVNTNITESRDQYIYVNFQNSCNEPSLAGIRGVVALEDYHVTGVFSQGGTCSSELACLYDPDSDLCASVNPTSPVSGSTGVDSDGNVIDCDTNNPLTNEDLCSVYDGDACFPSSIYESCKVSWVFQDELSNPKLFQNSNEQDQAALLNYYYIMYYNNLDCTQPVGVKAFVSDELYQLPFLLSEVSCEDAMACLYNADGDLCTSRKGDTDELFNFTYTVNSKKDNELSSCKGTLADNSEADCIVTTADQCTQSGVFVGSPCLFRIVPASFMARNPGYFVGNFDTSSGTSLGRGGCGPGSSSMLISSLIVLYLTMRLCLF